MTVRNVTAAWAAARVALGVVALLSPRALTAMWVGADAARGPAGTVLGRALGARDLSLGAGTAHAALTGRPLVPWILAGGAADAVDAAATVLAGHDLPGWRRLVLAAAGGSAVVAAVLAARVDH